MTPVKTISGRAYPLGLRNVDTDVIIGAEWLKTLARTGLGAGAFEQLRKKPGNVFEDARYKGSPILIAGENFGCGSSREHAIWALTDLGIRAVIAASFSDIFAGNAYKNGLLTVELRAGAINRLLAVASEHSVAIDLANNVVSTTAGDRFHFVMDPFRRYCLLNGLDEIGLTLEFDEEIVEYETVAKQRVPFVQIVANPWPALEL